LRSVAGASAQEQNYSNTHASQGKRCHTAYLLPVHLHQSPPFLIVMAIHITLAGDIIDDTVKCQIKKSRNADIVQWQIEA
jgi:hypothetical protein